MTKVKETVESPVFPRFIVRYIALAVSLLLIVGVVNLYKLQNQAEQQREDIAATQKAADIQSCQRGNDIRRVTKDAFTAVINSQIHSLKQEQFRSQSLKPSLFPGTPPDKFRKLLRQGRHDADKSLGALKRARRQVNMTLQPVHCIKRVTRASRGT